MNLRHVVLYHGDGRDLDGQALDGQDLDLQALDGQDLNRKDSE